MQTLSGHVSPETAYLVDDYPYGFRLRCQIRYWLEHKQGHGFRFVSQTSNPKKPGTVWNKPKASTYHVVAVMVLDEQEHVTYTTLSAGGWSKEDQIVAFETTHAAALTPDHVAAIRYIRATNKIEEYTTCVIVRPGELGPCRCGNTLADGDQFCERCGAPRGTRQTKEDQDAMLNKALTAGYRDVIAAGH